MLNQRSDKVELLRIAEAVAVEKSIDKEIILTSMESAIQKAAKTRFGFENDIRAIIDRESGDISLHKVLKIVEVPENFNTEISLKDAIQKEKKEGFNIGDEIFEKLPPVDFGRIAAQTARQVITQSVRAAERERQYNEFIDKKGEILSGIVKRLEYGNVIVDLNRAEAIIKKEELIPREILKTGYITKYLFKTHSVGLLTVLLRKEAYNSVSGFNNAYSIIGDFDMKIRLSLKWKFDCVQEPLAYYRIHDKNFSSTHNSLEIDEFENWISNKEINSNNNLRPYLHYINQKINFLKTIKNINDGKLVKAIKNIILFPIGLNKIKLLLYILLPKRFINK